MPMGFANDCDYCKKVDIGQGIMRAAIAPRVDEGGMSCTYCAGVMYRPIEM
jgi:hypothetical protein